MNKKRRLHAWTRQGSPSLEGQRPTSVQELAPAPPEFGNRAWVGLLEDEDGARNGSNGQWIAEDHDAPMSPDIIRKTEFLALLESSVRASAGDALAAVGRDTEGCPWIAYWFQYYAGRDASQLEEAIRRYCPEASHAASADQLIPILTARVRRGVERWARTGDLDEPAISDGIKGPPDHPLQIQANLGTGRELDSGTRLRLEPLLNASFRGVRIHTDAPAASQAEQLSATAFTVGRDIVFARDQYRPGTLAGDALLAHELAHAAQQSQASRVELPSPATNQRLESDANWSAAKVIGSLYANASEWTTAAGARLQTGLQLSRCSSCSSKVPPTFEEQLLEQTEVPKQILERTGFDRFLTPFQEALRVAASFEEARDAVRQHGRELWESATRGFQRAVDPQQDERALYWARLQLTRALRQWNPRFSITELQRTELMRILEDASRGRDTVTFDADRTIKRILISGFDPFGLQSTPGRGNPSSAAVLALDGQTITAGTNRARVEGVVFPVRFPDFNEGEIERFFTPYMSGATPVDMIMTMSLGSASAEFEVEEFAGRRRSAASFPDNLNLLGGGTPAAPVVAPGMGTGPEFLQSQLPTREMRGSLGRTTPLADETDVTQILTGGATTSTGPPQPGATAVRGSGGGYLSNEIMYRTLSLRSSQGATIPVGHLHVPDPAVTSTDIVAGVRQILTAVVQQWPNTDQHSGTSLPDATRVAGLQRELHPAAATSTGALALWDGRTVGGSLTPAARRARADLRRDMTRAMQAHLDGEMPGIRRISRTRRLTPAQLAGPGRAAKQVVDNRFSPWIAQAAMTPTQSTLLHGFEFRGSGATQTLFDAYDPAQRSATGHPIDEFDTADWISETAGDAVAAVHNFAPTRGGEEQDFLFREIIAPFVARNRRNLRLYDQFGFAVSGDKIVVPTGVDPGLSDTPGSSGQPSEAERVMRWSTWELLVHEYIHKLEHPVFGTAQGPGNRIMMEGFTELFTKEVLLDQIPLAPANTALRTEIEGGDFGVPPSGTVPDYAAGSYADYLRHAENIRDTVIGGSGGDHAVKAAFFQGHVELIGLTPDGAALTPVAAADLVHVPGGITTVQELSLASNVPVTDILAANSGLTAASPLPPQLHLPGTREHIVVEARERAPSTTTQSETRAQIAAQNGVWESALERANPTASWGSLHAGDRILIPRH